MLPSPLAGRGIFRSDKVYEFQTARVTEERNEFAFVRTWAEESAEKWGGRAAKRVPILPELVSPSYVADETARSDKGVVPIGVDKQRLETAYYDFAKPFVTLVLSQANDDMRFLQGLAETLAMQYGTAAVVFDLDETFSSDGVRPYGYVAGSRSVSEAVEALFDEMVRRNNESADARGAGGPLPTYERRIYVVPSLSSLLDRMSKELREKFTTMLEKCDASLGVTFVFADTASGVSTLLYDPWAKTHVSANTGIWVGNGLMDQFTMQVAKTSSELYEDIGEDFGYTLAKGRARLVKLLRPESSGEEADGDE